MYPTEDSDSDDAEHDRWYADSRLVVGGPNDE
jgi:hypothetical protein